MTVPAAKKAAKKVAQKKVDTAAKTARTGEKAVAARPKTKETSGPGSPKNENPPSQRESGAPKKVDSRTRRAASSPRSAAERRVESAKESHRKTASAVESKYRREKVLGIAEMRPKTRMLAAEYMAAIVMAIILLFLHDGDKTYHQRMSRFFVQMTGITGIFFVLALASTSEKVSRYTIPFGLLIDVSMLVYLFNKGGAKVLGAATASKTLEQKDPEYLQKLKEEEAFRRVEPTLIAPGLVVSPGNVGTIGGNLGGNVNPDRVLIPTSRTPGVPQ